jgi:hypothetical protein
MNIVSNPMVIGSFTGVLTYLYLKWDTDEKNKMIQMINKKRKSKNKKLEKEVSINLFIPLIVTIVVWFLVFAYFNYTDNSKNNSTHVNKSIMNNNENFNYHKTPLPLNADKGYRFVKDVITSSTSDPKSFSIINNNIALPEDMPDVLLEMF